MLQQRSLGPPPRPLSVPGPQATRMRTKPRPHSRSVHLSSHHHALGTRHQHTPSSEASQHLTFPCSTMSPANQGQHPSTQSPSQLHRPRRRLCNPRSPRPSLLWVALLHVTTLTASVETAPTCPASRCPRSRGRCSKLAVLRRRANPSKALCTLPGQVSCRLRRSKPLSAGKS